MYFPFFFYQNEEKKYLPLGKHRLYSLLLYNKIKNINKSFLFIEIPNAKEKIIFDNEIILEWFNFKKNKTTYFKIKDSQ